MKFTLKLFEYKLHITSYIEVFTHDIFAQGFTIQRIEIRTNIEGTCFFCFFLKTVNRTKVILGKQTKSKYQTKLYRVSDIVVIN